ncbi:hypothetical protein HT102_02755 [Hoyosella sp. G463]|uniref:Uncharacterized protein n=1 Tax=Lolliginicoccus lacisalsi TaxID=2742202 RepID=A0A927JA44_9ACTN|nr:hypothetical protein [Lolliginicoccus lacisalsi]MBD8505409.1 hypothetical protein [Lolliginicoccus lacisalsi]
MLAAAAVAPGPPLLVPELAGAAASETAGMRAAVLSMAAGLAGLAQHWIILGTDGAGGEFGPAAAGTFGGYGREIVVTLGQPGAEPDPMLPLPVLIGGWIRGQAAPDATCEARIVNAGLAAVEALAWGRALRAELDADPRAIGVLLVADGSIRLTEKAPGALDPRAVEWEDRLAAALDTGDQQFLAALDAQACQAMGVADRAAWTVLAGLFPDGPARVTDRHDSAPYGVGYHVGIWLP